MLVLGIGCSTATSRGGGSGQAGQADQYFMACVGVSWAIAFYIMQTTKYPYVNFVQCSNLLNCCLFNKFDTHASKLTCARFCEKPRDRARGPLAIRRVIPGQIPSYTSLRDSIIFKKILGEHASRWRAWVVTTCIQVKYSLTNEILLPPPLTSSSSSSSEI